MCDHQRAIARCMRITRTIRMRVMYALRHNPIGRATFKRERAQIVRKYLTSLASYNYDESRVCESHATHQARSLPTTPSN